MPRRGRNKGGHERQCGTTAHQNSGMHEGHSTTRGLGRVHCTYLVFGGWCGKEGTVPSTS